MEKEFLKILNFAKKWAPPPPEMFGKISGPYAISKQICSQSAQLLATGALYK